MLLRVRIQVLQRKGAHGHTRVGVGAALRCQSANKPCSSKGLISQHQGELDLHESALFMTMLGVALVWI